MRLTSPVTPKTKSCLAIWSASCHHDSKKLGLCNAKDLEVTKLQGGIGREQFILWRDGLDEFLANSQGGV